MDSEKKIRIRAVIPLAPGMTLAKEIVDALCGLDSAKYRCEYISPKGHYIARNRNFGTNPTYFTNYSTTDPITPTVDLCDYVLYIDNDIRFTPQDVDALVQLDEDVCSASYVCREYEHLLCCGYYDSDGYTKTNLFSENNGLLKVDWVGAGFLLVKSRVIDAIKPPWFCERYWSKNGGKVEAGGEDQYFSTKIRESGFGIWVNASLRVQHLWKELYGGDRLFGVAEKMEETTPETP